MHARREPCAGAGRVAPDASVGGLQINKASGNGLPVGVVRVGAHARCGCVDNAVVHRGLACAREGVEQQCCHASDVRAVCGGSSRRGSGSSSSSPAFDGAA